LRRQREVWRGKPADAARMARHYTARKEILVALHRSSLRPIAHGVVDAPSRNDVPYKVTVVMSLP